METLFKPNDPARARLYFESKLTCTTGPVELDRALKAGEQIVVVDVREHDEFSHGHIPGAINLPKEQWALAEGLRKDLLNVFYCYSQTCHLAATAAWEFAQRGFPVMELEGGFPAWEKCDLEIEREPVNRLKRVTGRLLHHRPHA